ncbi:DUF1684 domain-containing protein [Trueperella pecoris]|uniref:DUF1684 domain-containing protein n=1 Tax=Trueperella pecoris TaxID=2733571 RepID=UPI001ABED985|nr:DUF1684 domain-containing protein [Trueperella pecoris]QTG75440.1 DUF1684 domain-containing protein [Trueperella pecoris]
MNAPSSWTNFRASRNRSLAEDFGWLTLVSFEWVGDEPGRLDSFPGVWRVEDDAVWASFVPEDGVEREDNPVEGDVVIRLLDEESDFSLRSGGRMAEVAKRGGAYAVRVRDNNAPLQRDFVGVPVWDYDPAFVLRGVVRAREPEVVERATFRRDTQSLARIVADLELELPEERSAEQGVVRLALEGDLDGELVLNFYDDTNGRESADWRFVTFRLDAPGGEDGAAGAEGGAAGARGEVGGEDGEGGAGDAGQAAGQPLSRDRGYVVEIDFNYALNFPAAFTPYGTCPRPLPDNRIPLAVEAGERRPEPVASARGLPSM